MNRHYPCIIIGGGAAGLILASRLNLRSAGKSGLILEATGSFGTKLRMSGAGHCNFTHVGSIKEMVPCYGANGKSVRKVLYRYNNEAFRDYLAENGIPSFAREDGRVFPQSEQSEDVRHMLMDRAKDNGFRLVSNSPVTKIFREDDVWKIQCRKDNISADNHSVTASYDYSTDHLVIATGGKSYPSTGSNGRMWKMLSEELSITIESPRPALAPISVTDYPFAMLSGLSFSDTELSITSIGRKKVSRRGALLLTHRNFSGPAALNLCSEAYPGDTLHINYVPDYSTAQVQKILTKEFNRAKGTPAKIMAECFALPKRFCEEILRQRFGVAPSGNQKDSFQGISPKKLSIILTDDTYSVSELPDWNMAMATRGGITLSQIQLATMEFKEHARLYAIGEALDVDGLTGGYNLQFAFSSASVCGEEILRHLTLSSSCSAKSSRA